MQPSVTIGMPVRNGFPALKSALDSLLRQQFQDFELVISDNCSEDETGTICAGYAQTDSRIRYFRQDHDIGPMANFEFVLKQARGRLFMWAAHDDLWQENWLAALVPRVKEDVVMAYGQIRGLDDRTGSLTPPIMLEFPGASFARGMAYFFAQEKEGKANLIYGLFRKDALSRHKFPKGSKFRFGSDMHIVFTAIQLGTFVFEARAGMSKTLKASEINPERGSTIGSLPLAIDIIMYYLGYLRHVHSVLLGIALLFAVPIKCSWSVGAGVQRQIRRLVRCVVL